MSSGVAPARSAATAPESAAAPTRPAATRGPYAKTKGRRTLIASETLCLVEEAGHRAVTITGVAARAGLTEAQVLYHFPNRDQLLLGALACDEEIGYERHEQEVDALPGALTSPGDPEKLIAGAVVETMGTPNVQRLYAAMWSEATDPEHAAHAWALERSQRIQGIYADWCRALQEAGWAHRDVEPRSFALHLELIWEGLTVHWLTDPSIDLAREVAGSVRMLARRDAVAAGE